MATVLDIGLIEFIKPVFTFLLVFAIMFAILEKLKFLGDNKSTNAIIAVAIALLFMLTPATKTVIDFMVPWFAVIFIFLILFVLIFMAIGIKEEKVIGVLSRDWVIWVIVTIVMLAVLGTALSKVFGPVISGVHGRGDDDKKDGLNIGKILFDPKVLGAFFILLIAGQAVRMISRGITNQ